MKSNAVQSAAKCGNVIGVDLMVLPKGVPDVNIRSFPLVQEAELCRLIGGGVEIEILCVEAPNAADLSRGQWLFLARLSEDVRLVLATKHSKHRAFYRFAGLGAYAAHTLGLGHVAVPLLEGQSQRGMYHRSRNTGSS